MEFTIVRILHGRTSLSHGAGWLKHLRLLRGVRLHAGHRQNASARTHHRDQILAMRARGQHRPNASTRRTPRQNSPARTRQRAQSIRYKHHYAGCRQCETRARRDSTDRLRWHVWLLVLRPGLLKLRRRTRLHHWRPRVVYESGSHCGNCKGSVSRVRFQIHGSSRPLMNLLPLKNTTRFQLRLYYCLLSWCRSYRPAGRTRNSMRCARATRPCGAAGAARASTTSAPRLRRGS